MNDAFQKTVLQGEILALLHDIGKLTWRFVGSASGAEKSLNVPDSGDEDESNLTKAHTVDFLNEKDPLREILRNPLNPGWLAANGQSTTCLASLIGLHHYYKEWRDVFATAEEDPLPYPDAGALAMYADTSDSQFSKGATAGDNASPLEGNVEQKQQAALHLALPQGGVDQPLDKKTVDADAKSLADALVAWVGEGSPADWDVSKLWRKRNELQKILEARCSRHLAETRIPNNDVSLWQHTSSVAGIFKALLASRLLSGEWNSLLKEGKLSYTDQKLAVLAFRWDDTAFLARSMRSFEIVGRRARLHELSDAIKHIVEKELCLGNETYRDHSGIGFLVPNLSTEAQAKTCRDELIALMESLCNGELLHGDLPWKIRLKPCTLRLTDMLSLWREPFDSEAFLIASGPSAPEWTDAWATAENHQICPRCGLRPIPWSASRTGSSADTACDACRRYINDGAAVANELRSGRQNDYASASFGDIRPKGDGRFWQLLEGTAEDAKENRLALVQGIIPLDGLYDGSFFDALLSPPKDGKNWAVIKEEASAAWTKIRQGKEDKDSKKRFAPLLGNRFGGKKDGWCCNAPDEKYQLEWIRNLIITDEDVTTIPADKAVRRIVVWAARQHPSPSRLARMWQQIRLFMQKAIKSAESMDIPYVPLTCDAGVFQILVPAGKALGYAERITDLYADAFGRVRHVLPLHISASIFYHKAPLYIAMDAARRFARLASKCRTECWTLQSRNTEKTFDGQATVRLEWVKADGRKVAWNVPATLPNGANDLWHTWFQPEDEAEWPVSLHDVKPNKKYRIRPSTFDFEVLDASTRRYDIRSDEASGRRPHFMMPQTSRGPRPYPLEALKTWQAEFAPLFTDKGSQSQRKTALELLARLHADWKITEPAFESMTRDILINTFGGKVFDGTPFEKAFLSAAVDGTLFDIYEWYDFLDTEGADQ